MKSERGITLASLVIYVIITVMGVAILATIMAYFSKDVKDLSRDNIEIAELDKFYSYFLQDVKNTNNDISEIAEGNASITFTSGNTYAFRDETIFLNNNIKLAENIESCTFTEGIENGKKTITTAIKINDNTYTRKFVIGATTTIALLDEDDYYHHVLPEEYQKVEYIESTGTQYIDTNYQPNSNTRTIIDFAITKTIAEFRPLFGARDATNTKAYDVWIKFDTNKVYPQYGNIAYNGNGAIDKQFVENERCVMDFDKNVLRFNNTEITCQKFTFETSYNMLLLAVHSGATVDSRKPCARLYSCMIFDNEELKRNFIPCYRKSDGEPGLFDLVELEFYTNAGTGVFEVGSDNKERYQRVQYIQSDGDQYIDTGVIGQSGLEVFADMELIEAPSNIIFMGAMTDTVRYNPIQIYPGKWCIGYGNYYSSDTDIAADTRYLIDCKMIVGEQNLKVNNTVVYSNILNDVINTNLNMFVFTRNINGDTGTKTKAKLYSLRIEKEGDTIREFVPCYRKCDNKPGLYDLTNNKFYQNAATSGNDFNVGLPVEYQQVEHLESKGAQWIDTGIVPTLSTKIITTFKQKGTQNANNLLGSRNGASATGAFGVISFSSQRTIGFFKFGQSVSCIPYDNDFHNYILSDTEAIIDGVEYTIEQSESTNNNTKSLILMGFNSNNTITGQAQLFKEFKAYENGTLIMNLVPCYRKTDSKPGLYDTVSGRFFTNAGTSGVDFDVGPNV